MAVVKAIFSVIWTLISGVAKGIVGLFGGNKPKEAPIYVDVAAPKSSASSPAASVSAPTADSTASQSLQSSESSTDANPFTILQDTPEPVIPQGRITLKPTVIVEQSEAASTDEILIKAQPSKVADTCTFMVNRPIFPEHSWWYPDAASAEGSPLAEALFAIDDVETVLVNDTTITITRKDKSTWNWEPMAKEIGAAIRAQLQAGKPAVSQDIEGNMPSEEEIRLTIQKVIDIEVNPGVAAHGGVITLQNVKGNTVTISMGGGCQGCSAADLTLKEGIHNSFRTAQPYVGAILDETDHASGDNPFFS